MNALKIFLNKTYGGRLNLAGQILLFIPLALIMYALIAVLMIGELLFKKRT